ncbi:PREDICTED: uncharacterized protein LOC109464711 [Branchiostoma belcheri]|uniref:Uncharacterized protein LOC109464711 n=1 Tax=Branchiostoma belcheri TaxID=7741 RepID=A0A6P4YJQ6_BRABE|nr:PREDICTED: uncharacterized protein LOC109464711 [Branchiostoma belcheri]
MKTTAVLVCLALLVAIVHSAAVDAEAAASKSRNKRAAAGKALTELEGTLKKVRGDHNLVHDAHVRKELGMAKRAVGKMNHGQKRAAAKKLGSDLHLNKKMAKELMGKMHGKK